MIAKACSGLIYLAPGLLRGMRALVFDCDNTVAHTAPLHFAGLRELLAESGHRLDADWYQARVGLSGEELMHALAVRDGSAPDWPTLARRLPALFGARVSGVREIGHVTALIRRARGRYPLAIASGGTRPQVIATLEAIGLADAFDAIVTREEVAAGKPDPALFLEAARRIAVAPQHCLAFEDSAEGFRAARAAGMRVVDIASMAAV